MKIKHLACAILLISSLPISAQKKAIIDVHVDQASQVIPKEIYGQFAEHLGSCIYGGLWVGEDSNIPNIKGYRKDVFEALKDLSIPVMRWPGGCFADKYNWKDGIGPRAQRPKLTNITWGGTVEDNSFGTHEFLNLCEMLGCEPYISGNVGSGTVEELAKWVEYMTSDDDTPMANLRRKNGRDKPWKVKYIGIGNESWGCGGNMEPEYYSALYRRYQTYCCNFSGNKLYKIASGASDYNYDWTKVLMKHVGNKMQGLSLHYYTVAEWNHKGSALNFNSDEYYSTIGKCLEVESVISKHSAVMDTYDKDKKIGLILDEWGTWWDVEPGTNPGHLYQQNSMRDALVASLSLDIFNRHTDRLKMTNIAQVVNVLQSMILTKKDKMLLTPTYFIFKMYKVHENAIYIPSEVQCDHMKDSKNRDISLVSTTVSKKDNIIHISLSNVNLKDSELITINLPGVDVKSINGKILTSKNIADHNTFEVPNKIQLEKFDEYKLKGSVLVVKLPAKSIVTLELK
ncbi:MAG: alpha-L-arabinofuranosidase C-terminal domain-containing protein [Bacteroidales bacterium]